MKRLESADVRLSIDSRLFVLVAGVGIVLRVIQFLADRSLYVDEAAIALNLRDRGLAELLARPLDFAQTAPAGFLLVQDVVMSLLGEGEGALRLIPFLAGCASVPLFVLLARRLLPPAAALFSSLLFSLSFELVFFTADSKPYSIDVLLAIVALLVALELLERQHTRAELGLFGAFGALVPWLSQTGVLVLAALAPLLLWRAWSAGQHRRTVMVVGFIWLGSCLAAYLLSLRMLDTVARAYMRDYWAGGFMPFPPRSLPDIGWLPAMLHRTAEDPLGSVVPAALALLVGIGAVTVWRAGWLRGLLVSGPILVTLLASAAGQYPFGNDFGLFSGRVILFLVPCLLLLTGFGLEYMRQRLGRPVMLVQAVILVIGNLIPFLFAFPIFRGEIRPVLEVVARERKPSERIYVYYGARHLYEWYAQAVGLRAAPTTFGVCARLQPRAYLSDLDRLAGERVWVVITHVLPNEPALILEYLRHHARAIETISEPGALAVLFEVPAGSLPGTPPADPSLYRPPSEYVKVECRGIYEWPGDSPAGAAGETRPRGTHPTGGGSP